MSLDPSPAPESGHRDERRTAAPDAASSHRAALLFAGTTLVVCCAVYGDVVFGGRTFLPLGRLQAVYADPPYSARYHGKGAPRAEIDSGAHGWVVHPFASAERRAIAGGELPFWDPHAGLGHALLADGQSQVFNPLHALVLLDPDQPLLWDLHFLLLRALAGFFSCWLLFEFGIRKELCLVGAAFGAVNPSFTVFLTRADLESLALLPLLLCCALRLRKRPGLARATALAAVLAAIVVAGHPEPAFATAVCGGLCAVGFTAIAWPGRARYLGWSAFAAIVAGLCSAPYWLPFLGLIGRSWSAHQVGGGSGHQAPVLAFQWLIPSILVKHRTFALFPEPRAVAFLGAAMSFLALLGPLAFVLESRTRRHLAFLAGPAFFALRTYGAPLTSWIDGLPLLDRMPIELYFQGPALYCLGIGGVLALGMLVTLRSRRLKQALFLSAALLIALAALSGIAVPKDERSPRWPLQALYAAAVLAGTATIAGHRSLASARGAAAIALLAVVTGDLALYRQRLSTRGNFDEKAPYVAWLQERQRTGQPFHVMGLGGALMPNTATAFALDDARLTDALVDQAYMDFVRRFLQRDLVWGWFFNAEPGWGFDPKSPALDWMNVRYLVSTPERILPAYASPPLHVFLTSDHHAFGAKYYSIEGKTLPVLFQHPDDSGAVELEVPRRYPVLAFSVAQDPQVWTADGDGATYQVSLEEGGRLRTLWSREVDPKRRPADRRFVPGSVDLSAYAGGKVRIVLSARSADTRSDWGGWADPRWETLAGERQPQAPSRYIERYRDADQPSTRIYENTAAWPRVFASGSPIREVTSTAVLERMATLLSQQGPHAVVGPDFPDDAWSRLCSRGACAGPVQAEVTGFRAAGNEVRFAVELNRPAVVVDVETLAAGWTAEVDGGPAQLFHANHCFRGLLLGAGRHEVWMRYRPPEWSKAMAATGAGAGLWIIALATVCAPAVARRARSPRPPP